MSITYDQAVQAARGAGFSGAALTIIVAIAQAESSLDPNAQFTNTDGSLDRGILQINNRWHPEVSDACAYNVACAFQQGFKISNQGSNFSPWATFKSGAYTQYTGSAGKAVSTNTGNPISAVEPSTGNPISDAIGAITAPIAALNGAITTLTSPTTWVRVGLFLGALVLVIIGFAIVANGEMSK
jgi:hypothetical protein